ncbi:hypothetical protein AURDEDRAFT_174741 [Auricularia subglabra TFB-10046 SS5]|nr:hypothetical protein AURDEDRAFT_174741 [Auricularia subglabra TFB-10046 SS5]
MSFLAAMAIVFPYLLPAGARLANFTIDNVLAYYAAEVGIWNARSVNDGCTMCKAQPDPGSAYRGTWWVRHSTAVYVYFILANNDSGIVHANTHLNFYLDGEPSVVGTFDYWHNPAAVGYLYNQLVFKSDPLPADEHNLLICSQALGTSASLALFDYAIYSAEVNEAPSPPLPSQPLATPRIPATRTEVDTVLGAALVGIVGTTKREQVTALGIPAASHLRNARSPGLSPNPKATLFSAVFGKPAPRGDHYHAANIDVPPHYLS